MKSPMLLRDAGTGNPVGRECRPGKQSTNCEYFQYSIRTGSANRCTSSIFTQTGIRGRSLRVNFRSHGGGYDPQEAITFWTRMASMGGEKPPVLLSDHPADQQRIEDLKKNMPEALMYYQDSKH